MYKNLKLLKLIFNTPELPLWKRRTLITLRILMLTGVITMLIMLLCSTMDWRSYYLPLFLGLTTLLFAIPGLTIELFIRDLPRRGAFNIPVKIRLLTIPFLYGVFYVLSPILYDWFWAVLSEGSRSRGGNTDGLQTGIWWFFFQARSHTPIILLCAIFLLLISWCLCYLISSKSWRQSVTAILLLVLLEAAAALAAGNSPG